MYLDSCAIGYHFFFFRHKEVCKKAPDDICAYFDVAGESKWFPSIACTTYTTMLQHWIFQSIEFFFYHRSQSKAKSQSGIFHQQSVFSSVQQVQCIYVFGDDCVIFYPQVKLHFQKHYQAQTPSQSKLAIYFCFCKQMKAW